jgi:protease I
LNYSFSDVKPAQYDALYLPGGRAPEYLRTKPEVIDMVSYFVEK